MCEDIAKLREQIVESSDCDNRCRESVVAKIVEERKAPESCRRDSFHHARKYLQNGFGGLVLCFKTDEADLWRSYLQAAGREGDGCFFGVEEPFRFNFMDYEAKSSRVDFAENLTVLVACEYARSVFGYDLEEFAALDEAVNDQPRAARCRFCEPGRNLGLREERLFREDLLSA